MSKTVKAKFICNQVDHYDGGGKRAHMHAVSANGGENVDFAKATPSGELSIGIDSETNATDFFKPGKSYYLEFEEAPYM